MKFGGTSVADLERITAAAERVRQEVAAGHAVAVVVSAMAGETNRLVALVERCASLYDTREYDTVTSAGEQVTAGLMALVLQQMGIDARSWLGWQIPFMTDSIHGKARINKIDTALLERNFAEDRVAVIAGFQGLSPQNRITTLGRGGSDTSAVALAAALGAVRCDIYTDVNGVYTTDPRIVAQARKIDKISHEEMLEMASQGAKVLHTRSVGLAMNHGVRLRVLSSFTTDPGTLVVGEDEILEEKVVTGIAYSADEAKITLVGIPDIPGVAAGIFGPLAAAAINVDMIVQSASPDGKSASMTFTTSRADSSLAMKTLEENRDKIGYANLLLDIKVAKISVIGAGMRSHPGVAQTMFTTLAEKAINIQGIATSEIKISTLIAAEYAELAVRALHDAYGLETVTP